MRAAVIQEPGRPARAVQRPTPERVAGQAIVAVTAAPITPLDVLCASGTSYFGRPATPYVPGVQGVGVVAEADTVPAGTRVWFPSSAGMAPGDGSMAEYCAVPEADLVELAASAGEQEQEQEQAQAQEHAQEQVGAIDDELIAALGYSAIAAWMALTWRAELREGEQVLVLGGGGVVGQVAVQAARLLGARRVVAVCRSDAAALRAHTAGADEVVVTGTGTGTADATTADAIEELAVRLAAACDGGGADVVIDPVFGVPAAAAARVLAPFGRLVNLGGSAGGEAVFDSATLRGRSASVLGYTNNALTPQQRSAALRTIVGHAAAGRLRIDHDTVPLDEITDAWSRQADGSAPRRIVVRLRS